jgi:hypothetical protein
MMMRHRSKGQSDHSGIDYCEVEKRKKERSELSRFIIVLPTVFLGGMINSNPFLWIKFCGLNCLIRRGLVGAVLKI